MTSSKCIVLGGGMVAGYAAKELVSHGLGSWQSLIISADDALPYERPPLSKGFLSGKENEAKQLVAPERLGDNSRAVGDAALKTSNPNA